VSIHFSLGRRKGVDYRFSTLSGIGPPTDLDADADCRRATPGSLARRSLVGTFESLWCRHLLDLPARSTSRWAGFGLGSRPSARVRSDEPSGQSDGRERRSGPDIPLHADVFGARLRPSGDQQDRVVLELRAAPRAEELRPGLRPAP